MNYNEWSNYTAQGYLKYALDHYNKRAGSESCEEYRKLTAEEISFIEGCMYYAFDMKTLEETYNLG